MKRETISDGWGSKYLAPFQNESESWQRYFDKALQVVANGGSLIIIGNRGSGKTRIAAEISRHGVFPDDRHGKFQTSAYRRASEIFIELRDAAQNGRDQWKVIQSLSGAGLLVIDEMQERGETEWENRMITTIIDRRYSDNLPTILIANLQPEQMAASVSQSVISRINESGGILLCDCPSFRETAAK
jgi:DNA replication protein DnaC